MGYNLLINGIYWGYNPLTNLLLTSWDIQVGMARILLRLPSRDWASVPYSSMVSTQPSVTCSASVINASLGFQPPLKQWVGIIYPPLITYIGF